MSMVSFRKLSRHDDVITHHALWCMWGSREKQLERVRGQGGVGCEKEGYSQQNRQIIGTEAGISSWDKLVWPLSRIAAPRYRACCPEIRK